MNLIRRHINILLPLLVITAIARRFIPELQFLYYPTPILLALFTIAGINKISANKEIKTLTIMLMAFGMWSMLTSFWSDYFLFSFLRGGYFVLLILGTASGIYMWCNSESYKQNPFGFLFPANILVLVTSLFSLILNLPKDAWTGGNGHGFMGIFGLQLSLGMALLITIPAPLYSLLKRFSNPMMIKKENLKEIFIILFIILLNILFIVLSHSRAALISLTLGIFLVFIFYFNFKQRLIFIGGLFIIALLILTIPSLKSKVENYALKGTNRITANREILWIPSYEAAKIGGLYGIGYGTSTEEIQIQFQQIDEGGRLRREKGNSILGLIEEVGLIGLILFITPIIYVFILLFKRKLYGYNDEDPTSGNQHLANIISISFLIAFILHAQSEAWWVGTGSFALLIFLMFLSLYSFSSSESV